MAEEKEGEEKEEAKPGLDKAIATPEVAGAELEADKGTEVTAGVTVVRFSLRICVVAGVESIELSVSEKKS